MEIGYDYARRLHADGTFSGFHLEEVMLPAGGHVQEVLALDRPGQQGQEQGQQQGQQTPAARLAAQPVSQTHQPRSMSLQRAQT